MKARWRTEIGRCKPDNQDVVLAFEDRGWFVILDGMGGRDAGYLAAHMAAEALQGVTDLGTLPAVLAEVSRSIWQAGVRGRRTMGMGAAVLSCELLPQAARLLHAGDCRAFWVREGRLLETLEEHRDYRGLLTRHLGLEELELAEIHWPVQPHDVLLLCSDGLTKELSDEEIVENAGDLDALVEMGMQRGGRDNISVVTLEI